MKTSVLIALLFSVGLVNAQEEKGIKFQHGLSWAQIKQKAKTENKYIFLDAFTTWCGPCKMMDKNIFPQQKVGDFFNTNFINVKVQMDVTKADNMEVRSWYKDAKNLENAYKINSYPTYLFFDPEGKLVHRISGTSATAEDFIMKAEEALIQNEKYSYAALKRQYESGKKDPDFLLSLINKAQLMNDEKFETIAINEYLKTQKDLLSENNLKFMAIATRKSTDPGFTVLLNQGPAADAVLGKGKSAEMVTTLLFDEIVLPHLRHGGRKIVHSAKAPFYYEGELNKAVNWAEIKETLDAHYPALSKEIMMKAKAIYYEWAKNWPQFCESASAHASIHTGESKRALLNSYSSTILYWCTDKQCMESALAWSEESLSGEDDKNVVFLNTYSNLLYKSGKQQEAIKIMEKAVKLAPNPDWLADNLNKMKKGEKIW